MNKNIVEQIRQEQNYKTLIRNLRKQLGLTQEELAERLGVALNTISRIEIGQRGVSIDLALELAVHFNSTLDYIIAGRGPAVYQDSSEDT